MFHFNLANDTHEEPQRFCNKSSEGWYVYVLISQSDVKAMKKIVASQINWSKVSQDNPDNAQ